MAGEEVRTPAIQSRKAGRRPRRPGPGDHAACWAIQVQNIDSKRQNPIVCCQYFAVYPVKALIARRLHPRLSLVFLIFCVAYMQAIDNMGVDAMFKSSVLNILRAKYSKQRFWVAGGVGGTCTLVIQRLVVKWLVGGGGAAGVSRCLYFVRQGGLGLPTTADPAKRVAKLCRACRCLCRSCAAAPRLAFCPTPTGASRTRLTSSRRWAAGSIPNARVCSTAQYELRL